MKAIVKVKWAVLWLCLCISATAFAQDTTWHRADSLINQPINTNDLKTDSALRIINLNPYFTLQVDSSLSYQLQLNKNPTNYFWYIRNSPVGLRINKDNGMLTFNAQKSFFLSGKLKYDVPYKVQVGVQNMAHPAEKVDTVFTIVFYNLEIIPSKVKPAINSTIWVDEGETISFKVFCETGSFPIENILTFANMPIGPYTDVQQCGKEFKWTPTYDLVKDNDSGKVKIVNVFFVGATRFYVRDTASIRIIVRDGLNYPFALMEYNQVVKNIQRYVLQLKFTFLQLDKKLKRTKTARTTFDLTAATTSLTGTILGTSGSESAQRTGKILPSVGLAMVPIKEASVPARSVDQNQASLIRASIKRLEYVVNDNILLGNKDWDIARKTNKLKEDLKQVQVQLFDIPVEITNELSEEELNRYFNSPKVNKKYRLNTK